MIKISVVIPTYNRGGKIFNTLKSLAIQTFKDFEVIVVNDGSTDNTREVLDTIALENFPFNLRIIHQNNMGRAGVRNSGFNQVSTELIVSLDDDMRLDENCLREHYKHHQKFPGTILVGHIQEDPNLAITDIQKYLAYIRLGWLKRLEEASNPMLPDQIYISSANFSITKTLFSKIGGFDPTLKAVIDYDLAMRAAELNIPIYYNKNAIAWHDDFITCRSYILRRRQSVENEKLLLSLKPDLVKKYHRYKDQSPSAFKLLLYSLLAQKIFVKSIDKFNFFPYVLPKKLRYSFYSAIVMSLGKYFPKKDL